MKQHQSVKPSQYLDPDGNKLISGTWGYVKGCVRSDPSHESLKFVVTYIDKSGKTHKAYSRSAFSHDIKEAILHKGVVYD